MRHWLIGVAFGIVFGLGLLGANAGGVRDMLAAQAPFVVFVVLLVSAGVAFFPMVIAASMAMIRRQAADLPEPASRGLAPALLRAQREAARGAS